MSDPLKNTGTCDSIIQSILWFLLMLLPVVGHSQTDFIQSNETFVQGTVMHLKDNQPMPFVRIYNKTNHTGTISNYDGFFKVDITSDKDTLLFTFMGYENHTVIAGELINNTVVFMSEQSKYLGTVNILADNSFLYDLIEGCSSLRRAETKIAKTYFGLETFVDDKQVELLECYYNGFYTGYEVTGLELKMGRSALNVANDILFLSLDISKAFYKHKLFEWNGDLFPHSPFEFRKRKLKKVYDLTLASKYRDEQLRTIYVIQFDTKSNPEIYFDGKVWIDSLSNQILKVELEIDNAKTYPFSDNWSQYAYENINMRITKTFEQTVNGIVLNAVYFDYDLNYKISQKLTETVSRSTRSVLQVFDYDDVFVLPFFYYPISVSDYRKISAATYDSYFWKNYSEFRLNNEDKRNEEFFHTADFTSESLFNTRRIAKKSAHIFESEYVFWDEKRIFFAKNLGDNNSNVQYVKAGMPTTLNYNLDVQIYVDIVELTDTFYVRSETVFNPFETYYNGIVTEKTHVFINTYFDLIEIHRRILMDEIAEVGQDIAAIQTLYNSRMEIMAYESDKYLKEVNRGENEVAMEEWNAFIWDKLKINNLKIFSLDVEAEDVEHD